ncbi:MAG: AtpZ/AtpI family protein [Thermodesulfobacteriota bacterium]|nr:AtpZ/AtpI family protein [Thermodesulfobacteriota bacterium]
MKRKKLSQVLSNRLVRISTCGFMLVLTTFLGLYVGVYLDGITNMAPNFTLVCLIVGIILGFKGFVQETIIQRRGEKTT